MAGIVLVAAQRLDQIVLALIGDVRNIVLARKSRGVTDIAAFCAANEPVR
jgi:hypothetical protein